MPRRSHFGHQHFPSGTDTPRDLLERCLARFEEFEPAVGTFSATTSARRALPRPLPPSGGAPEALKGAAGRSLDFGQFRMRVATYNVNGVNGRLGNLLDWLDGTAPDIVCLQELKAPDEKFPAPALRAAGYGAVWHGQKSWNGVAILARGADPVETRRGLPGDPDDTHSRYLEAVISGLTVGCLYLPNGNPAPGPKFDYKLRWFERLTDYAQTLLDSGAPVILAGDFNVMPTELDVYAPERWVDDALFRPEVRDAYRRLVEQGWTDALRALHPGERTYTFWKYFRNAFARDAGLRIDHLLLSPAVAGRLVAAGVDREVRGRERSSDHAPVWIELTDARAGARDGRRG